MKADTHSDRDGRLVVQVLELVDMPGKKGLFDKERSMGFEQLSELLGHTLVHSAVEVTV